MSLPDILLSLLREPLSGTDLIRLFQGSIRHFWKTDLSEIYRALDALEREGCLHSESLPSSKGPARRVYHLTDPGRTRLAEWIRRPAGIPAAKFEYLAQLFSVTADRKPRERARALLASMREQVEQSVHILEALDGVFRRETGGPQSMPTSVFYPWLTLRHGLIRRRGLLQWIDECVGHLDERPGTEDEDAGPEVMSELGRALQMVADEAGVVEPTTKKK